MRDTWVEVSRDAMRANFDNVAKHAGVPVCAVVKANGYGHGIVEAARTFAIAGASMLGVSRLDEARALRNGGIDAPIFVMLPGADPASAEELRCEITVGSARDVEGLRPGARAHLEIDTGMGRSGVPPSEAVTVAEAIGARATLAAVWMHFADAAQTGRVQLDRFRAVVRALRHHGIECAVHASNSAALLSLADARFDMVRVGTLLYGEDPPGGRAPWQHRETFTWYARVAAVRTLRKGASLGYGGEWIAPSDTRVATLPVGWADGFTLEPRARTPSPRQVARAARGALAKREVFFDERPARVIGRVAMQSVTVSLQGLDDIDAGVAARVPARRLSISPMIERVYP